jgi:thiamine-monophosphate kinase
MRWRRWCGDEIVVPDLIRDDVNAAFRSDYEKAQEERAMTAELAFIAALRRLAAYPGARELQDDCAVVEFGGEALVLTHDMIVEGVHFLSEQDPTDVAWKLVATNMSDLAAKGAEPIGVLLGYTLGRDDARFLAGLEEALAYYRAPLLGGDTVSGNGAQALGLTAIGRATHRPVPSRAGARAGDRLCITGPVGAAMLGLEALRSGAGDSLAYRRPRALLTEGQALAPHVSAMMDVSDGLLLDAARLARASGVTLAIDGAAVPIAAPEARRAEALRWGDDYQLLFTASASAVLPVAAEVIGQAEEWCGTPLLLDGRALSETDGLGFEHR